MDGHIGVYDGEKYTYECTVSGGTFRIIKTVAKTRGWTNWGKCAYIKYEDDKIEENKKFKKYYIKVTANRLNVREGAGTNYKVIKTIKKDEKWLIRDEKNGWGKIRIGWIKLSYTKKV